MCNWYAANEICAKYTAGGKTWRLPNNSEMSNWYNYTEALGASGPQICDSGYRGSSATTCYSSSNCKRPGDSYCYPGHIWAQQYSSTDAYYSYLDGYSWSYIYYRNHEVKTYAYSVRCVTEIEY